MATCLQSMALLLALTMLVSSFTSSQGQLSFGFYSKTCPSAENIVSSIVQKSVLASPDLAAVLLRLHFHDCFVQGCDASILINNGPTSEQFAFGHQGVRGFEVIEEAKAQLEAVCPGVVSCADIVAMAARDSVALSNGPAYQIQTGRRDGRVSNISFAADMPDVSESAASLKAKFLQKGLSEKDLVVLNAAHTIGTTACFFMTQRLYKFPGFGTDPTINPSFLPELKAKCPENGDVNDRLGIDQGSERAFDDQIVGVMSFFNGPSFAKDFADSMVKMGKIGVKTGQQGEIRRVCKAFN